MIKMKPNANVITSSRGNSNQHTHGNADDISLGRDLLIIIPILSWVFLLIQSFQIAIDGTASLFGPGMGVFDQLMQLVLKFTDITYVVWSICVSGVDSWGHSEHMKAFFMWQAMVAAMMVPTLFVLFRPTEKYTYSASQVLKFVSGYMVAWIWFSVPAVVIQWILQTSGILNDGMVIKSPILSGIILIVVGLIQFFAIKRHRFVDLETAQVNLNNEFQKGPAYLAGLEVGLKCILLNWPLMATMFVFGLMNIIVMALLTLFMIVQKTENKSRSFSKLVAGLFIALGVFHLMLL